MTGRGATRSRGSTTRGRGLTTRRRPSAHARRPGPRLRVRVRRSLPAPGRIAAVFVLGSLIGGLLALVNGPWLRVAQVAWAGERFTPEYQLQRSLAELDGVALLAVDATEVEAALRELPAVASARVSVSLPSNVVVTIVEKEPAFLWQTSAVRLIGAADGTLIGQMALRARVPDDLAALPQVDDRRVESRNITVGDRIEARTLASALRLAAVEPRLLGSRAVSLALRLTDADGFLLVSAAPAWEADFGYYPEADDGVRGTLDEQVEAQLAAIRTLYSVHPERTVGWIDVRDPGRVYWRP